MLGVAKAPAQLTPHRAFLRVAKGPQSSCSWSCVLRPAGGAQTCLATWSPQGSSLEATREGGGSLAWRRDDELAGWQSPDPSSGTWALCRAPGSPQPRNNEPCPAALLHEGHGLQLAPGSRSAQEPATLKPSASSPTPGCVVCARLLVHPEPRCPRQRRATLRSFPAKPRRERRHAPASDHRAQPLLPRLCPRRPPRLLGH